MGIPSKAVIASHAEPSAGSQDPQRAFHAAVECFLVAIDHTLGQSELRPELDAGFFKVQGRNARNIALEHQIESFVVHEGSMLDAVVTCTKRVLDPLGGSAVACDLEFVVVSCCDHGVHFFKCHAQGMVIVGIGRGCIAGRIGFDPLDPIFDQRSDRFAGIFDSVDDKDQALHADLSELGVPVHEPSCRTDLATACSEPRPRHEVFLDRSLEPHIDIEQTPARPSRRIAALEG